MGNKIFAYARKNLKSDSIEEQVKLIKNYCEDNDIHIEERDFIIEDSENIMNRDGYNALLSYIMRSGDILTISEFDRLGKDISAINDEWIRLNDAGIELLIINNPLLSTYERNDKDKECSKAIVSEMLQYFSEKEKNKNKRRQAEGIQALKEKNNGKGVGRPKTKLNKEFKDQYKLWKSNKQTAVQTFNNLGLTKATFYRLVKEYEADKK